MDLIWLAGWSKSKPDMPNADCDLKTKSMYIMWAKAMLDVSG